LGNNGAGDSSFGYYGFGDNSLGSQGQQDSLQLALVLW
jgi:hypothetical protein